MKNKTYVVNAYKWGSYESHSYTLGVFNKKDMAIKCADSHCDYRGRKYACVVEEFVPDVFDNDSSYYTREIYRAKSVKE